MTFLIIISSVFAVLYVGAVIWSKRQMPDSVSAMVYLLPNAGQWLWGAWLFTIGGLLLPPMLESMPDSLSFIAFLTVVCLFGTAVTPLVQQDMRKLHNIFGISAGILSQVCVLALNAQWLAVWMLWLFLIGSTRVQPEGWLGKSLKGKGVFLSECICYTSLVAALLS